MSSDLDPGRYARRERAARIAARSAETRERMRVWQEHRTQVVEAGRAGGRRLMALHCGQCPTPKRRDRAHGDVIDTPQGVVLRAFYPTSVVDRDSGQRMTLPEVKAWDRAHGGATPRWQVEAWLLDDPTPLPSDVPTLHCMSHGPVPVNVAHVRRLLAEEVRVVRVAADGTIASM